MTENDKVIVQAPEKQKIEIPISIYLLIFLQIALLALIAWDVDCLAICLRAIYFGI